MPLTAGTRIGSYDVVAAIGAGGMGEVYRAHDTKLGRDVALKVLPAVVGNDPERLARFRREAQLLAALNDPHIAQIYGFEDAAGAHALVMELVDGPTLAERLAAGPLAIPDALAIARQIAAALDAAHERGIVHRDLKPANIKVREDGRVKVLDFGLAKAFEPPGEPSASLANSPTMTVHATEQGMILGTAAYMAPEQARGRPVDKRADVWAFGVVLFEMLAGRRLFDGEDVSEILAAVLRQDIDWTMIPTGTPRSVVRLLHRCLERDPRRRLRDIGDALIELDAPPEPALVADAGASRTQQGGFMRALPWMLAAAAVVVAAGALTWALERPAAVRPAAIVRSRTVVEDAAGFLAMSHDGATLAYTVITPKGASLAIRRLDELDARLVAGSETGVLPFFSPDDQWIAYTALNQPRQIKKILVNGGTGIMLCEGALFGGAAWSDDGYLIFSGNHGLMRVPVSGGTPETVTTVDTSKGEVAHVSPQFLPGSRQLLFLVVSGGGASFAVLDAATHQYRTIAKGGASGRYVADGYLTYVRDETLFAVPFDASRLVVTGPETPVVPGVAMPENDAIGDYSVSDTGLLAYAAADANTQGTTLEWADATGHTTRLPGASQQQWGHGRLSPDGRRIANAITVDRDADIWVMDTQRGTLTRLSFDGAAANPVWTPDGRNIVYWRHATAPARSGLYRVPADNSGPPELVFASEKPITPTSISPDGKTVLAQVANGQNRNQIYTLSLGAGGAAGGELHPLHDASASEADAQFSPDGRWVAYDSTESGGINVFIQPFPGPGPRVRISPDSGATPRWTHDGRALYYWRGTQMGMSATLVRVPMPGGASAQPGTPEPLFQLSHGTTWGISPDGDRFLVELSGNGAEKISATVVTVTNWFEELRRRVPAGR